jgi:hypothetical protein
MLATPNQTIPIQALMNRPSAIKWEAIFVATKMYSLSEIWRAAPDSTAESGSGR